MGHINPKDTVAFKIVKQLLKHSSCPHELCVHDFCHIVKDFSSSGCSWYDVINGCPSSLKKLSDITIERIKNK